MRGNVGVRGECAGCGVHDNNYECLYIAGQKKKFDHP